MEMADERCPDCGGTKEERWCINADHITEHVVSRAFVEVVSLGMSSYSYCVPCTSSFHGVSGEPPTHTLESVVATQFSSAPSSLSGTPATDGAGPYSIGHPLWNGLSKLIEEGGEVVQVCGKLIGTGGKVNHWDGSNLCERLHEEMADLMAAIRYVAEKNALLDPELDARVDRKLKLFKTWNGDVATPLTEDRPQPPEHEIHNEACGCAYPN